LLTISCVLLGASTISTSTRFDVAHLILVLIGVLLAHASVNAFNEYADFRSGLDLITSKTPFSGGSGSLPANPEMARSVLLLAWACLLTGIGIGFYLAWLKDLQLLPIIAVATLAILFYTQWATRRPIVCLLLPGFCFGSLVVVMTDWVLSGSFSTVALCLSFVPFFQVNNLLLLNQYPDIDADREVGRRNLLIAYGMKTGAWIFVLFYLLSYLVLLAGIATGLLPATAALGLLTAPLAFYLVRCVYSSAGRQGISGACLALNVAIVLLTPVFIAAGLLLGRAG
jgi:1,4-dihydroxy-2-naphthoate octaprenyltransferase